MIADVVQAIADIAARTGSGVAQVEGFPTQEITTFPYGWVRLRRGTINRFDEREAQWIESPQLVVHVAPWVQDPGAELAPIPGVINGVEKAFSDAFYAGDLPSAISRLLVDEFEVTILPFNRRLYHSVVFTFDVKEHTP